jgi:uncharacterized protein (TIRG00374 family)
VNALGGHKTRLALGCVFAALLLYLFFRGVAWKDLGAAFRTARWPYLACVVGMTVVVYVLRAWRWGYLLAPIARPPFKDLFAITLVGFASALLIPRAGEVLRPYLIGRRHGVPTVAAFASIILERLLDMASMLALFALYLFVLPTPAAQARGPLLATLKVVGGLTAAGTLLMLVLLWLLHVHAERVLPWIEWCLRWLPRRVAEILTRAVRSFADGLAVLRAPANHLLALVGQSLLLWLAIASTFNFNHLGFGLDLPFHATFFLMAFLTVGVAIPTPGNVGGFHAFYLFALTEGFVGIDRATAAAAGIMAHALTNLPVLVLGLFFLGREGLTLGRVAQVSGGQDATEDPSAAPTQEKEDRP